MLKKTILFALILILVLVQSPITLAEGSGAAQAAPGGEPYFQNMDLYAAGTEGYHTFRIPSLITTKAGTVLAFAEGRKNSASDTGNIDLVLKRSFDQGRTWQPLQIVCDAGADTCGNPTPVQDESTGRIWLFLTQNYGTDTFSTIVNGTSKGVRTIWSTYSDDEGATWSPPVNRFAEVQPPNTRWDGTGPGNGIQLRQGPAKGRLVIPVIGRNIQSDDHGVTWYQSGKLPPGLGEPTVVELTDGVLMRNDRLSSNQQLKRRAISTSPDQGATWSPIYYDPVLIDPIVEASIIRYKPSDNGEGNRMLLFSNPADTLDRENMTVRISNDDGQTWTTAKPVYKGPSAYSSLSVLPDGKVGLLFEGGPNTPYDKIMYAVFNIDWLFAEEADLDNILFSGGSLSPVFRGDLTDYSLALYTGTEEVSVTPVTSDNRLEIAINGRHAEAGVPVTVRLDGLDHIAITSKFNNRTRNYTIRIDRTRPMPELLMHWDFERTDASGVTDVTYKHHTGLLKNGATTSPGLWGNALYLDGQKRSHVEVTNIDDLHFGKDNFTFAVWAKPDSLFRQHHFLVWYGSVGQTVPMWWMSVQQNGAARMNLNGVPLRKEVGVATQAGLVKPGQWTHIAGVREGNNLKVYVNGELAATSAEFNGDLMDTTNRNAPMFIGFDKGTAANRDWNGSLDDIRIYHHALDPSDIRKLYYQIDKTAPVTNITVNPSEPNGNHGWYTSNVSVGLTASDDLSGVASIQYRLNGGEWAAYEGMIVVSTEGTNLFEYRSVDQAGNVEASKSRTIRIDKTAPRLKVVPDRTELWPPNHQWIPVTVTLDATDDASGIGSVVLTSITSSEPDGKKGSSEQVQKAEFGTTDTSFELKAERNGDGTGRVYTIVYRAVDLAGIATEGTATVTVPHDQSKSK